MSKQEQVTRRRDEETRLNAEHLATQSRDEDEDWGDVPPRTSSKARAGDADLDAELEREETASSGAEEVESPQTTAPVSQRQEVGSVDVTTTLQQLEQLQSNIPAVVAALESKIEEIEDQKERLEEQKKGIQNRISFLKRMMGMEVSEEQEEEEETPQPRRGRRGRRGRRAASTTTAAASTSASEEEPTSGKGRGGKGGKRHQNDQTLKEAICKAMVTMPNFTGHVNEITKKVLNEQGYKTTSTKPTNTVRIQMYRLEDESKVRQNDDGSYTLRRKVAEGIQGNGD
jgi:hypothetical protein